jgi:Mg-chelatase subunit ChlD/sugar lactone lactonase YvrE
LINDVLRQSLVAPVGAARGTGTVTIGGPGVLGYLDNLRISDPPKSFDVMLVLDVSGSMAGSRLASLKTAAERALDALASDVPVALITFSDAAQQLTQGFTLDRDLIKELIRGLEANGGTDYEAALASALDMVQRFSSAQRHIEVFISDGVPNTPPSDAMILEQAAANIRIFSIGFQLDDATELQRLASLTGGKFFNAPTATELQTALREIFESGVFSVLYLFDDDAVTAEDFMHMLDWDYALTNVAFSTAAYYEAPLQDKDNDALPDWWENLYGLNINNADGDNGPNGDPDGDGLNNLYEYLCDTNPRQADTDGDGVTDAMEDYDQDGLSNGDEQTYGSDPRVADTDDDGTDDREEKLAGTSPSSSLSPWKLQALSFGGTANDYVEMAAESRFALAEWTVEAWVRPHSGWAGGGSVLLRSLGTGLTNYFLDIDTTLRPVAGFGSNRVVGTAAIVADGVTWTHLAATYQLQGQELRLYVNGTEVARRTCGENPPTMGAGPLAQRIGQRFSGLIAEVRLWNVPRSAQQISEAMGRALAGTESGLIAYYRGNDGTRWSAPNVGTGGNNLTGGAVDPGISPWMWGQVEDFAGAYVTNDWMRRWRSCATIRGNVSYSNTLGVVTVLPAVRVILQPAGAVAAGGQWSVNGGAWHNSGDYVTISDTNALTLQLGYRTIYGWTPPSLETVTISNGITTTLTRYYRRNGTLTVHLEPAAISNDAAFRVDGGAWQMSGVTVSNVSPGSHLLEYKDVEGWAAPVSEGITLGEGEAAEVTRFYQWAMGRLVVYIAPAGAVAGGAKWTIDGSNYYDSGYTLGLTSGVYIVQFKNIAAWDSPSNISIAVTASAETNATGIYTAAPDKDSDADELPDWWEVQYGLDPFDPTGINGMLGDADADGLVNLYEYWSGTDPLNPDTDADGVGDGSEDADGDGLTNRQEQDLATRPDRTDTDDDGWSDGDELNRTVLKADMWHGRRTTGPGYSRSPWIARSMRLTGSALTMSPATCAYVDQQEWMIDLWYLATNSAPVSGRLIQRVTTSGLTNFCLRLVNGVPVVEFQTPQGIGQQLSAGVGISTNEWVHLTASWKPDTYALELTVNERSFAATLLAAECARGTGTVTVGESGLGGYLDNLMVRNAHPQDVIMVLDVSGSMEGTRIQRLRETAKLAVDLLPEDTPIALIPFSSTATNLSGGFLTDRSRLKLLIDSLTANGLTSYKSAVGELTNVVAKYSTYERHLCLFLSDGAPTESPSLEEILAARDKNIRIDTIGLELWDASALQQLSQLTGGTFYDVPTPDRLQAAFAGILRQIFKVRYVFDDGGSTAEDVEHPLNWAYALSNVTFSATAYVDPVWSGDVETGIPTWWKEFFYGGEVEAWSDTDGDGLSALYEYWSDTHPLLKDTDGDGILDSHEDYDLDGLNNADEQAHGTDPRLADTDDDGIRDLNEKVNGTAGNNSLSPLQLRTLRLGGSGSDYVEMPRDRKFALSSWTLEAWVCPSAGWGGDGTVIRRVVANGVTNFFLSVDGSRRPMAGFGGQSVTGAVAIAADGTTWTHLAATYDAVSQELLLYVNTTQVAQRICSANPEVNGVGPLIQRIGERWNGQIDEVRIWKSVRSAAQIASSFVNPLEGTETDLLAYYRFDDGTSESASGNVGTSANNLENGLPAGGIARWTWGQVEDFALNYSQKDWTNRWGHAATLRGNAVLTNAPGAVYPQPCIRVLLYPAGAVAAGGKWSVNGGAWKDSGDTVSLLGTQLVVQLSYRDGVYGWTPPTNETITLTNGQALTLTRYYRQNGTLTVSLQPMAAASNGAQWSVSGGLAWNDSDVTVSNLSPGAHAVIFQTIPGWIAPAATNVDIPEGGSAFLIATYEPLVAPLYGVIEPPEAITNGAMWRVDGGTWTNSGTFVMVSYGAHTVDFYPLTGWVSPNPIGVNISDASARTVTGQYRRITGLQVFIEPETARLAGASWRVSGGSYYASGVLLELTPATYTVDFLPLAGWIEPLTQQVVVVSNSITTLNVRYFQFELIPTNFVGLFTRPRGIDFDSQRRLYIADSMNNRVVVYDTRTGTATNFGGPVATNTLGMFNQPLSVALDAADHLYVADANNHRIQRRNAQTGTWTAWGGPVSGTNVGQFNTPFDVAVDSFTNLYVADHYNHRVQKRIATNGAWVVLISNGFANGFVRFPAGVEIDASNRLYVSDFPSTNDGPRIQVFSTNGLFVEQIGGRATALGGMERPYRMDFGLSNDLFVAEWGLDAAMRRVGTNAWEFIAGSGRLNNPEGVAWEDRGYLYIADTDNQRIIRVLVNDLSTNIPPVFSGMALGPSGMVISWPGALGWFYTLQYTDTGFDPWYNVPGCVMMPGTNGVISCTDTNNFGIPTRIYRVLYY